MTTTMNPPPAPALPLSGKRLLVVDDDQALLLALTKVLRKDGAEVLAAHDASDAVQFLSLNYGHIDLVLTDIRMPGASGKSILSAVKGSSPDVPVIIMTAFATDEIRQICDTHGAYDLLDKPVNGATVLATIRQALSPAAQAPLNSTLT